MKIKLNREFMHAMAIAAACSLATTLVLLVLSLISWGLVFAALMILFMPIAHGAIKFYKKTKCIDLEDFFSHLIEEDPNKIQKEDDDYNTFNW